MNLLRLTAGCDIQVATGGGPAPVEVLACAGGLMTVPGFGPVAVDLAGRELTATIPLLSDHDATLKGVVGGGTAEKKSRRLFVRGGVSRAAEAGRQIIDLHKDGVQWQASVGVEVKASKPIRAGETIEVNGQRITAPAGGIKLVTVGLLRELTITALGCDTETSVAIAAQYEGSNMIFEQWLSARGFFQTNLDATQRTSLQAMYDAEQTQPDDRIRTEERERIGSINAACRGSWGSHQATVDRMQAQAIAGEIGLPALEAYGERVVNQGGELRGASLPELAAMALRLDGMPVRVGETR